MFLLALALACGGKTPDGADSAADSGGDSAADSGGDSGADTGSGDSGADSGDSGADSASEAPTITSADARCYFHDVGDTFWNWIAECTATDPQGTDTLARSGTVTALLDGAEVATYTLSCDVDAGLCSTTFREDADGILCAQATTYTFRFQVGDEDDHASAPVEVTGHEQ